jgi:hypothetical protein
MKFSKSVIGASFGGALLAALNTGAAEAATDNSCKDIDLHTTSSVADTFRACLSATEPLEREGTPESPEISNQGCEAKINRQTGANDMVCTTIIPRDQSCPVISEDGPSDVFATVMGNDYNGMAKKNDGTPTADGRTVGSRKCRITFPGASL